ncbi:MAG: protein kinase [Pirellulales bacterium]
MDDHDASIDADRGPTDDDVPADYERLLVDYDESLRRHSNRDDTHAGPLSTSDDFQKAKACIELMHRVWHPDEPSTSSDDKGSDESDAQRDREPDFASDDAAGPREVGRFKVVRELGRGGLGVVFLAQDPHLGRPVALKLPRPEALISNDARRRFLIEGELAASLSHPGIVPVFEVGTDGAVCYIASQYCNGETLAQWLGRRQKPVPIDAAARIVRDLAAAVAHAHARGIIHRDIKPGNVMVERSDDDQITVKLTDFGTAKLLETDEHVTRTGVLIGTAAYMAPEQARGLNREIDVRTDVHALGAVLYELLTGVGPFAAQSEVASIHRVTSEEPLRPGRLRRDVPRDLEAICLKCLCKQPDDRYATSRDLVRDLNRFLSGEPTRARPVGIVERAVKWARRRPALAGLSAALACSLVASVIVVGGLNVRLRDVVAELTRRIYTTDMQTAYESFHHSDLLSTRTLLESQSPARRNGLDVRDWSWRLLNGQSNLPSAEWPTHAAVFSVAVSPDGRLVVSGDEQSMLIIRALDTGAIVAEVDTQQGEINTVAFATDGSEVATAGKDGTVRRWRSSDGTVSGDALRHDEEVYCVAYAADGTWLASGGRDMRLRIWRPGETTPFCDCQFDEDIECLAVSPTVARVVVGLSNGDVCCYDVSAEAVEWSREGSSRVSHVGISHDGRVVTICRQDVADVDVLAMEDGQRVGVLSDFGHRPTVCQFLPDDRRVVVGCRDGHLYLCTVDIAWQDTQVNEPTPQRHVALVQNKGIRSLALDPEGRRVVTAGDGDAVSVTELTALEHAHSLRCLRGVDPLYTCLDPAGRRVAAWDKSSRDVTVWDVDDAKLVRHIEFPIVRAPIFVLSGDGHLLAVGRDTEVEITTASDAVPVCRLVGHEGRVTQIVFSPDASLVVTVAEDDTVRLWDVATGAELRRIDAPDVALAACSSVDQLLALADHSGTIRLWDERPEAFRVFAESCPAQQLTFSPTRRELAVANTDGQIIFFHADNGGRMWDHEQIYHDPRMSVVFSPDGDLLLDVRHGNHNVLVLIAQNGKRVGEVFVPRDPNPANTIDDCRFTPDGRNLVMSCHDGVVHVRDLPPLELFPLTGAVTSIDVARESGRIVAADKQGRVEWRKLPRYATVGDRQFDGVTDHFQVEFVGGDRWIAGVAHNYFVVDPVTKRDVVAVDFQAPEGHDIAFSARLGLRVTVQRDGRIRLNHFDVDHPEMHDEQLGEFILAADDELPDGTAAGPVLTACALSGDDRWLATASASGKIILWPLQESVEEAAQSDGEAPWRITLAEGRLWLDPDSRADAPQRRREIVAAPIIIDFPNKPAACVAFSPDGRLLAGGGARGTVVIYDLFEHREHCKFVEGDGLVRAMVFSGDSQSLFSAGNDDQVHEWNVGDKRRAREPIAVGTRVNDLEWLDETRLAWAGDSGVVGAVVLPKYEDAIVTVEHDTFLVTTAITADGQLVTLDEGSKLSWRPLADLRNVSTRLALPEFVPRQMRVARLSPGGDYLAVAYGAKVQVVSVDDGQTIGWLDHQDQAVNDVAFWVPDSLIATACGDSNVWLWELPSCRFITTLPEHHRAANALAFSPDGSLLASGSGDNTVIIWDVGERRLLHRLSGHTDTVGTLCFSPSGTILASGGDTSVRLWSVDDAVRLGPPLNSGLPRSISFSPDGGTLVVASEQEPVVLFHVESGRKIGRAAAFPFGDVRKAPVDKAQVEKAHGVRGFAAACSPDGDLHAVVEYGDADAKIVTLRTP